MIKVRFGAFETNSSSVHSLCYGKERIYLNSEDLELGFKTIQLDKNDSSKFLKRLKKSDVNTYLIDLEHSYFDSTDNTIKSYIDKMTLVITSIIMNNIRELLDTDIANEIIREFGITSKFGPYVLSDILSAPYSDYNKYLLDDFLDYIKEEYLKDFLDYYGDYLGVKLDVVNMNYDNIGNLSIATHDGILNLPYDDYIKFLHDKKFTYRTYFDG